MSRKDALNPGIFFDCQRFLLDFASEHQYQRLFIFIFDTFLTQSHVVVSTGVKKQPCTPLVSAEGAKLRPCSAFYCRAVIFSMILR